MLLQHGERYSAPMTVHRITSHTGRSPSALLAAEVRAEVARQGLKLNDLAERMAVTPMWLQRRVGPKAAVDITLEEAAAMAEALNVAVQGLLPWLPRLDSNQQPSGSGTGVVLPFRARAS